MSRSNKIEIPEGTMGIQPVRIDIPNNRFCYYESFRFANGGIWQLLMQCGGITTEDSDYTIDFLNDDEGTIGEVKVTHDVFYAIVKRLKAKRLWIDEEFRAHMTANKSQA